MLWYPILLMRQRLQCDDLHRDRFRRGSPFGEVDFRTGNSGTGLNLSPFTALGVLEGVVLGVLSLPALGVLPLP